MAGKFSHGADTEQPAPVIRSRAYCEGFNYRISDTSLNNPITDNPYSATADPTANKDWDTGWSDGDALALSTLTADDCGPCAGSGVTVQA